MSAKHTRGPWHVTESGGDWSGMSGVSLGIDDAFGADGGRDYCLATVVHGDPDELQANARLIAAAPELLAVLQEMLPRFQDLRELAGFDESALAEQARAAIAKATQ